MEPGSRRVVLVALAIGFGLRVLATWSPIPRAWGLDTFRHQPPGWAAGLVLLGALGFLPGAGARIESALDRLGAAWERAGLRADAVVAALVGALLFTLRDPARFVGDAGARYAQLFTHASSTRIFPQATWLDRAVSIELPRAISRLGFPEADAAQAVPALIGAFLTLVLLAFARAAGARRRELPGLAALLLCSAIPIHMAGYGKFGLLLLGIGLIAIGVVLLAREGRGAIVLGAGAALAVLGHRSGYLLAPAVAWALVRGSRSAITAGERRELAIGMALALGAAAIELPHALAAFAQIDRGAHLSGAFTRLGVGGALTAPWSALQTLFYALPAWPAAAAALALARGRGSNGGRFGLAPIALAAGAAMGLELVLIRGSQGEVRDWDMHLPAALTLGLMGGVALIALGREGMRWVAPLTTSALAAAVALWNIHAREPVTYARVDRLLEQPALWTESERARAYDFIGMRALTLGVPAAAIPYLEAAIGIAPNPRYFSELGGALRLAGRPAEAAARYDEARRRDPAQADPWLGFGALALDRGDYRGALDCARRARSLEPERADAVELERLALAGLGARDSLPR